VASSHTSCACTRASAPVASPRVVKPQLGAGLQPHGQLSFRLLCASVTAGVTVVSPCYKNTVFWVAG
jgi:hypothetical protein